MRIFGLLTRWCITDTVLVSHSRVSPYDAGIGRFPYLFVCGCLFPHAIFTCVVRQVYRRLELMFFVPHLSSAKTIFFILGI
jgi:hypothetical protein